MTFLTLVLIAGAVYRITLLVTADEITAPVRDRLIDRLTRQAYHERTETLVEWRDGLTVQTAEALAAAAPDITVYRWVALCKCGERRVSENGSAEHVNAAIDRHVAENLRLDSKLVTLIGCPWCMGLWVSIPVSWSAWCFADRAWWALPAAALTASGVTGALAERHHP